MRVGRETETERDINGIKRVATGAVSGAMREGEKQRRGHSRTRGGATGHVRYGGDGDDDNRRRGGKETERRIHSTKKQIDEMTIRVRVNIKNGEKDDGRAR